MWQPHSKDPVHSGLLQRHDCCMVRTDDGMAAVVKEQRRPSWVERAMCSIVATVVDDIVH